MQTRKPEPNRTMWYQNAPRATLNRYTKDKKRQVKKTRNARYTLIRSLYLFGVLSVCAFQTVRVHTSARFGVLITFCFYSNVFYFKALLRFVLFSFLLDEIQFNILEITANLAVFHSQFAMSIAHFWFVFGIAVAALHQFTFCVFVFVFVRIHADHA